MPPRTDGRKLVALATAATAGAVGFGTIYLPFIADRDKLRGMFEEGDEMPEGARREIQAMRKAEEAAAATAESAYAAAAAEAAEKAEAPVKRKGGGSMWSGFRGRQQQ